MAGSALGVIYLTGSSGEASRAVAHHPRLGVLLVPGGGYLDQPALYGSWAADNDCFAQGARFNVERWLTWLANDLPREGCLFATAPDVVGDAAATWERSRPHLATIRELGFPAALVSQDGLTSVAWDEIDCLFTGGTTAWKLSEPAHALAAEAKRRGKWTHMGRVNSGKRIRMAASAGYDSADGTFLAFAPDTNMPRLLRWLDALDYQPSLHLPGRSA